MNLVKLKGRRISPGSVVESFLIDPTSPDSSRLGGLFGGQESSGGVCTCATIEVIPENPDQVSVTLFESRKMSNE